MPTFYAKATTVQLSVADLDKTITPNPNGRQCSKATQGMENVAREFTKATKDQTLTEHALIDEATGSHVRFLGENRDVPFFAVQAGKHLFDAVTAEKKNRRVARLPVPGPTGKSAPVEILSAGPNDTRRNHAAQNDAQDVSSSTRPKPENTDPDPNYNPPIKPHALCLSVFLSPMSFLPVLEKSSRRVTYYDIKIDVFFNGVLSHSTFAYSRWRNDAYSMTGQIIRFTGCRIGRMLEKPWIITPSGQNPGGSECNARSGERSGGSANERWQAIAAALLAEADKSGRNKRGDRSCLGAYLESLANLPILAEVQNMQKTGNRQLGVMDVAISWGKGTKNGPDKSYLTEPTPIKLDGFKPNAGIESNAETSAQGPVIPGTGSKSPSLITPTTWMPGLPVRSFTHFNGHPRNTTPEPLPNHLQSELPVIFPCRSGSNVPSPNKRTASSAFEASSLDSTTSSQILPRRMRFKLGTNDTRVKSSPKGASLSRSQAQIRNTPPIPSHFGSSSPLSSLPSSSPSIQPKDSPSKWVKLRYTSPLSPRTQPSVETPFSLATSPSSGQVHRLRRPSEGLMASHSASAGTTVSWTGDVSMAQMDLSRDCNITYAPGNLLRNVNVVRGGWFKEQGVLMGVRFLVE